MTTHQRRVYSVVVDRIDEFLASWSGAIPPLRRRHGFEIVSATIDRETGQFVWLLSHPGDRTAFAQAEREYYDSPEKRGHGDGLPPTLTSVSVSYVDDVTPVDVTSDPPR